MFYLYSLYDNYQNSNKTELIQLIETELSSFLGLGYSNIMSELRQCISITEEYTNNHQKTKNLPKNEYGEVLRKSGEPYINHPLRVALILIHERLFDSDVLKASIMHDLFEDTTYTYNDAKDQFGAEVADLIDCVTNISEDQKKYFEDGISSEEYDYASIITKCNRHRIAFYIKFADRLDNLMTLSSMPVEKQAKKIEDTENYMLPLIKQLRANRFLIFIQNAVFKVREFIDHDIEENKYELIENRLTQLHAFQSVEKTVKTIEKTFKKMFLEIRLIKPSIYDIYSHLINIKKDVYEFSQSDLIYDLYFVSATENDLPKLSSVLNEFLTYNLRDYAVNEVQENSFFFADDIRNQYKVHLITSNDFNIQQYGSTDIDLPVVYPNTIYDELVREKIPVYTPERDKIMVPVGATVIDFAFFIHEDIFRHMVGAEVNGKVVPVHTKLRANDEVKIIKGENPEDSILLNWILYCETKRARRAIYKSIKLKIDQLIYKVNEYENKK